MGVILHHEGKPKQLDAIIGVLGSGLRVRLFKNNFTPAATNVLADFTEANFTGYAEQTPVYGAAALNGNNNAQATAAALTFTMGTPGTTNTIYGWYEVDGSNGKVLYSERFGSPLSFASAGDNVVLTPKSYAGPLDPPA